MADGMTRKKTMDCKLKGTRLSRRTRKVFRKLKLNFSSIRKKCIDIVQYPWAYSFSVVALCTKSDKHFFLAMVNPHLTGYFSWLSLADDCRNSNGIRYELQPERSRLEAGKEAESQWKPTNSIEYKGLTSQYMSTTAWASGCCRAFLSRRCGLPVMC